MACPASTIFAGWRQSVLPVHLLGLAPLLGSVGPVAGPRHWQERGFCLLDDGSDVLHQGGKYTFGWYNQLTRKQVNAQRSSSMPDNGRPEPTKMAETPVMQWPDRTEVWNAVMNIIEFISNNESEEYAITEADVSYRVAPSLYHAVSMAIAKVKTNDYIAKYADSICSDVATAAIAIMHPDELAALIDQATKEIAP